VPGLRPVEHAEGQREERVVLRFVRSDTVSEIPYARASPTVRRSDEEPHRALRAPRVMGDLSGTYYANIHTNIVVFQRKWQAIDGHRLPVRILNHAYRKPPIDVAPIVKRPP